jgi:hypothetical protein
VDYAAQVLADSPDGSTMAASLKRVSSDRDGPQVSLRSADNKLLPDHAAPGVAASHQVHLTISLVPGAATVSRQWLSLSQAEPFWPSGNSINLRLSSANKPSNIFRSASVVAMDARLRNLSKFRSLKNLSISMVAFFPKADQLHE